MAYVPPSAGVVIVTDGGGTGVWTAPRSQPSAGRGTPRSSVDRHEVPAPSAGLPVSSSWVGIPGPPLCCSGPSSGSALVGVPVIVPAPSAVADCTMFDPVASTAADPRLAPAVVLTGIFETRSLIPAVLLETMLSASVTDAVRAVCESYTRSYTPPPP